MKNDESEQLNVENDDYVYLTELEDFEQWEPLSLERTSDPIIALSRWGERQIPGLAELHDAIAEMSNPDGTFRED